MIRLFTNVAGHFIAFAQCDRCQRVAQSAKNHDAELVIDDAELFAVQAGFTMVIAHSFCRQCAGNRDGAIHRKYASQEKP